MIILPFCSSCVKTPQADEQILFLEFRTTVYGESTEGGECPTLGPMGKRGYKYSNNRLRGYTALDIANSKLVLGCSKSLKDEVGSGTESILFAVQEFPFTPPAPDFCQGITILSVDDSGYVDYQINGDDGGVDDGLSHIGIEHDDSIPGCDIMISTRISNFGFLTGRQIHIPSK